MLRHILNVHVSLAWHPLKLHLFFLKFFESFSREASYFFLLKVARMSRVECFHQLSVKIRPLEHQEAGLGQGEDGYCKSSQGLECLDNGQSLSLMNNDIFIKGQLDLDEW
mmetsp:Transcript_1628/g.1564  ORF Transcript_1628/g.1564 Transcript_1628/m.1564 type:complete len:110 (+) Transcript_1628:735-1064(+)